MKEGDKIHIKLKDVVEVADAIESRTSARTTKDKIADYNNMKQYLEKEGLL